jgi:hypothetical protein
MVEQEARLTEANRLLALVSTRYAAARYHYIIAFHFSLYNTVDTFTQSYILHS